MKVSKLLGEDTSESHNPHSCAHLGFSLIDAIILGIDSWLVLQLNSRTRLVGSSAMDRI